jgi:hypothetical protein
MTELIEENLGTDAARTEAESAFKQFVGITDVESIPAQIGSQRFLKFVVGRRAPIYEAAIRHAQKTLGRDNEYRGLLGLECKREPKFPQSVEANVLIALLTRATRQIVGEPTTARPHISWVPFPNREDNKVVQPATHLILGRRGVGKSTLIMRAAELLSKNDNLCVVLDMQPYSLTDDETLPVEVLSDLARALATAVSKQGAAILRKFDCDSLDHFADEVGGKSMPLNRAAPALHRLLSRVTKATSGDTFVFLDDYHLLEAKVQPRVLHLLHAATKGTRTWLKVAGLRSLLNAYDPKTREGLQVPGDAQQISLDLTLVDPETAERHLRTILENFLKLIGIDSVKKVIMEEAFRRLVWANAGVPRDFLQMLGRSLEHAKRSGRSKITLTDANLVIGEFGQQKMDAVDQDARNEQDTLRRVVQYLEKYCLEEHKVNAFLVRSDTSEEKKRIQVLSDLRIVHVIHPTITPHKAGERYEAYLLDYCLFTGFRRRPNIREMRPADGKQFKASELRKIPILPRGFLSQI